MRLALCATLDLSARMVAAKEITKKLMSDETRARVMGEGPWAEEPDRIDFVSSGLACLMLRSRSHGAWCGYVGVPPGHLLHGCDTDEADKMLGEARPHGGVTYAAPCESLEEVAQYAKRYDEPCAEPEDSLICHVPRPGMPDDVHWLGFDAAHARDVCPARDRDERHRKWQPLEEMIDGLVALYGTRNMRPGMDLPKAYRDAAYIRRECEKLAAALAGMNSRGGPTRED